MISEYKNGKKAVRSLYDGRPQETVDKIGTFNVVKRDTGTMQLCSTYCKERGDPRSNGEGHNLTTTVWKDGTTRSRRWCQDFGTRAGPKPKIKAAGADTSMPPPLKRASSRTVKARSKKLGVGSGDTSKAARELEQLKEKTFKLCGEFEHYTKAIIAHAKNKVFYKQVARITKSFSDKEEL